MDRYHKVRAFVLAVQRREKDISATLFTLEKGKISVLAKGARTLSSHRLAALQTGYEISAQLYQKNEYFWLSEAQTITPFLPKNSLGQLSLLFFFSELLDHAYQLEPLSLFRRKRAALNGLIHGNRIPDKSQLSVCQMHVVAHAASRKRQQDEGGGQ